MPDDRLTARMKSPAAARNRQPILEVLETVLPSTARVLEVASGSGEHAVHCARAMPDWVWQPSDPSPEARASIEAWRRHAALSNLLAPLDLAVDGEWPPGEWDAIVAINLAHISPWTVTEALMARAGERLVAGGTLYLYGPFKRDGRHTSESNVDFDADLRARDPRWGVRPLEDVLGEAHRQGLTLERVVAMPANNLSVVLRRRDG